ncbi:MAG: 4Fe-4S binding protein [bacterium]
MKVRVDGVAVHVAVGATLLDACDLAGVYVTRLCAYPGLSCCVRSGSGGTECGLCVVRLHDGSAVLACATPAAPETQVTTDDHGLRALRLERLARILAGHPHICLTCPDRDGCARDECTYGNPPEARCCDEFGRCELGRLVTYLDPDAGSRRTAVTAPRQAMVEGRIRREPGLCIGCGRCVTACEVLPEAGLALEMAPPSAVSAQCVDGDTLSDPRMAARPKRETLRASGCTFCGQCILVCPTGALTAPGDEGARWLAGRRAKSGLSSAVLPPERSRRAVTREAVALVPPAAGVFMLIDGEGQVLRIGGAADLREGLARALGDPVCATAAYFQVELDPLYTQRESELLALHAQEHGHLPAGNDLGEDLFGDEPF